ncbi:MAG: hypothetical protein HY736_25955 [Verrucomicrobia bacterium]|nr:hypothetical protein [Verrucomicrobiota bacterium]
MLTAGEKLVVRFDAGTSAVRPVQIAPVPPVEIERALAWQERRLDFVSVPLEEIAAEFNRYNHRKLIITGTALATQRFGGTFRPDDAAGFVRMLESNFGIVAEQGKDATILRVAVP